MLLLVYNFIIIFSFLKITNLHRKRKQICCPRILVTLSIFLFNNKQLDRTQVSHLKNIFYFGYYLPYAFDRLFCGLIKFDHSFLIILLSLNLNRWRMIFSSPCQRQCELLPSLGIHRLLTFHILIFSSEIPKPNELKLGRKHL
jgi:hypothetical protein